MNRLTKARARHARALAALDAALQEVKDAALEARADGQSLRAIAAELGVSYARVFQITKGDEMSYTYWNDDGIYLRRSAAGCDILRDGVWVPVDPAKFGGSIDPWAAKIGNGDVAQVKLSDVPVKGG